MLLFSKIFKNTFFYVNASKILIQGKFGALSFFSLHVIDTCDRKKRVSSYFPLFFLSLKRRLYRSFLGISIGFLLKLKIDGIGFKGKIVKTLSKKFLCLSIGYNHTVNIKVPLNINLNIIKGTTLVITSNSFFDINLFGGYLKRFKNIRQKKPFGQSGESW